MIKINNYFKISFALILVAESISLLGYIYPVVNSSAFFLTLLIFIPLTIYRLEYGVLAVLAELVIGSKGYLFDFNFQNFSLSIRIALWLSVMTVWFVKETAEFIKDKEKKPNLLKKVNLIFQGSNKFFAILFAAIILSGIIGIFKHNNDAYIFDEFKRWTYFLFIFPLLKVAKSESAKEKISSIVFAGISWLCLETLLLLFIFSHGMQDLIIPIYRWIRTTGVGEITNIQGGFYRIFFQSHIYVLLFLFVPLIIIVKKINHHKLLEILKQKNFFISFLILTLFLTITLISLSRSFWVGLAAGFILTASYLFRAGIKEKQKAIVLMNKQINLAIVILSALILSLMLIFALVKFPYPKPTGGFDATNIFTERATETNEAAIGSRWSLLPKLWDKISAAPILGQGLGSTVTYKTQDPRVLEKNPDGDYTTYSFEWGWLDIWLKLGIFGLLSYISVLVMMIYELKIYKDGSDYLPIASAIGILVLAVINIFTPYLNHPLGIGFLLMVAALLWHKKNTALA